MIFEDLEGSFEEFGYLDEDGLGGSGVLDTDEQADRRQPAADRNSKVGIRRMQAIERASDAMQDLAASDPELNRLVEEEMAEMDMDGSPEDGVSAAEVSDDEVNEFLAEMGGQPLVEPIPDDRTPLDPMGGDASKTLDIFQELRSTPQRQLIYERGMPDQQLMLTVKDRLQMVAESAEAGQWFDARYTMRGLWRKRKLRLPLGRILWNLMIKAHVKAGRPKGAESWIVDMMSRVYQPDIYSFNTLLQGFGKKGDYLKVESWMRRMAARGVAPDLYSYTSLAESYAKSDDLEGVQRAIDRMEASGCEVSNVYAYNAVLKVCVKRGEMQLAEHWLQRIQEAGLRPDRVSYLMMIRVASQERDTQRAAHWLEAMEQDGHQPGRPQFHALMTAHAKAGDISGAEAWSRVMGDQGMAPDAYTYNILISAAATAGDVEAAEALVLRMEAEADVNPDTVTYATMIGALAEKGDPEAARNWLFRAEDNGIAPDVRCYNEAIKAFSRVGNSSEAERLARRLLRHSLTPDVYTYNTLLGAFAKDGNPAAAEFWVDHMQRLARWRHTKFPVKQMAVAYREVLNAYVRVGNLEAAEAWHSQMLGEGVEPDAGCYLSLVRGHLDQGREAEARKWLHRMSTWSSFEPPQELEMRLLGEGGQQPTKEALLS